MNLAKLIRIALRNHRDDFKVSPWTSAGVFYVSFPTNDSWLGFKYFTRAPGRGAFISVDGDIGILSGWHTHRLCVEVHNLVKERIPEARTKTEAKQHATKWLVSKLKKHLGV